jgi:hypothetical protein
MGALSSLDSVLPKVGPQWLRLAVVVGALASFVASPLVGIPAAVITAMVVAV